MNLIRNFCKYFEIIVPFNCHSAGTIISLGANRIVMTKQATLGPIDPSVMDRWILFEDRELLESIKIWKI